MRRFLEGVGDALAYLGMGCAGMTVVIQAIAVAVGSRNDSAFSYLFGLVALLAWCMEVGVVTFVRSRLLWTDTAFIGALLAMGFMFHITRDNSLMELSQFLAGWGMVTFLLALVWGIPATGIRWFLGRRREGSRA